MKGKVFINYRRDDAKGEAIALRNALAAKLPGVEFVIDVEGGIPPGENFIRALEEHVAGSNVLLCLIGPRWLTLADESGRRRIDDPGDLVQVEIVSALKRDIQIIPILIDDSRMPGETTLPQPMRLLAFKQAMRLRHDRFNADANGVAVAVRRALPRERGLFGRWIRMAAATLTMVAVGLGIGVLITKQQPDAELQALREELKQLRTVKAAENDQHVVVREIEAYNRAVQENTSAAYRLFLAQFGQGQYRAEIEESLATCRMESRATEMRDVKRTLTARSDLYEQDCERLESWCRSSLDSDCSSRGSGSLGRITFRQVRGRSVQSGEKPQCSAAECEAVCEWSEPVKSVTVEACRNPIQVKQDKAEKARAEERRLKKEKEAEERRMKTEKEAEERRLKRKMEADERQQLLKKN